MKAQFDKRRCPPHALVPGVELGETLYSSGSTAWLTEGTILNAEMIRRLVALGLNSVIIREYQPVQVDIPRDETVVKQPIEFVIAPCALQAKVDNEYEVVLASVGHLFTALRLKAPLDVSLLDRIAAQILEWSSRGAFIANFLLMAARREDYPVQHSVHVAAVGGVIGKLLELPDQERKELVLCGLLHDVGFLSAANESLDSFSPAQLENARAHPVKGFKLLQSYSAIGQRVLYGVLQHHERCDGSGYPLGLGQDKVHRLAKIIAVADTYDLLTSGRDRGEADSPFQVMQKLREEMLSRLDPASCAGFLDYLTKVMIGNIVLLSDGVKAQVVYWRSAEPQPVVRKDDGQFIDLAKQKDLSIVKIIGA